MSSVADRDGYPARDVAPKLTRIAASFAPNGSSAVSAASNRGGGGASRWSVARSSAGLFLVTIADSFLALDSAIATLQLVTAKGWNAQIGNVVIANRTIEIRVVDATWTVQDVAADANNRINFSFVLRGSAATA